MEASGFLVPHFDAWNSDVKTTDFLKEQFGEGKEWYQLVLTDCLVISCSQRSVFDDIYHL